MLAAACVVSSSLLPVAAWAQANPAALSGPAFGNAPKPAGTGGKESAPPALPGARAEPAAVAPATKTVTDLPPNEALFDAINRGDLPSARDAVGRGADLNGTNVLGLTPIELAVDLGRNQISFYLLSLRGVVAGSSASGQPAAVKPPSRAERLAADRAAAQAARAERTSQARAVAAERAPPTPQTARLFTGGGGTAIPQSGFLGFDPNH